jgi:phosphate starvation-inducible protein PhoH and related proteins
MAKRGRSVNFDISLNDEQVLAKERILSNPFNFLEGKAGSGKTLLAVQIALDKLFKREVSKIVITRPTVGTEDNGFLPGTFEEKMEPWMVPIRDNMRKVYNHPDKLTKMELEGVIELVSLSHFRGRTFENAVCIIDEFQNLTKQQLIMALGRLGKNSVMIFCGDEQQIDLKFNNDSAIHVVPKIQLSEFVHRTKLLENHRHPAVNEVLDLLLNYN